MVASRVVKVNDAIAQKAADAMGKIEGAVVGGYTKIEDRFVEAYLTHEGETVEQAKERLRREEAERKVVKAVSADAHGASDGAATGAERVHLRKLRSGQSFLYREGGYNSTVVEVRMTERVSGSCLQSALTRVSRRFPYLTQKLVERGGSYYLADDSVSLVAKQASGFRKLGSSAVGYHLIDVTYTQNLIRVAFHHGLCDGAGIKPFVESLVHYYCRDRYHRAFSTEGIRTEGETVAEAEYAEPFGTEPFATGDAASATEHVEGYRFPEATDRPSGCWRTEFKLDEDAFVASAKQIGSTPSIFLALVLASAVVGLDSSLEAPSAAPVVCNIAVDYRHAIGADATHCNCVGSVGLPLTAEDRAAGWHETARRWRALLDAARDPEAVRRTLNKQIGLFNKLDEVKGLEEKRRMMAFFDHMVTRTLNISYLGRLRLNDCAAYVESACFYSSHILGMTVDMLAASDTITVNVLQGFPTKRYARAFEEALRPYGLRSATRTERVKTGDDEAHETAGRQGERYLAPSE